MDVMLALMRQPFNRRRTPPANGLKFKTATSDRSAYFSPGNARRCPSGKIPKGNGRSEDRPFLPKEEKIGLREPLG